MTVIKFLSSPSGQTNQQRVCNHHQAFVGVLWVVKCSWLVLNPDQLLLNKLTKHGNWNELASTKGSLGDPILVDRQLITWILYRKFTYISKWWRKVSAVFPILVDRKTIFTHDYPPGTNPTYPTQGVKENHRLKSDF